MSYNTSKANSIGGGGSPAKRDIIKCGNTYRSTSGKRDSFSGSTSASPDMPRRESLVKPTWQNISPGQVPVATLDRLRKMSSGEDAVDYQQQQQLNKDKQQSNGGRGCAYVSPSNRLISATTIIKCVQREEPFDVFGKVNPRCLRIDNYPLFCSFSVELKSWV